MTRLARPASHGEMAAIVPGEPLIAFKDVHIGFDEGEILRGISFEVWPAETKILLGESGSGKTLIMKMAAGLLRPDAGRIWVMGQEIERRSEDDLLDFRRHVGFVFQEGALFDSLTVSDNVAFRSPARWWTALLLCFTTRRPPDSIPSRHRRLLR